MVDNIPLVLVNFSNGSVDVKGGPLSEIGVAGSPYVANIVLILLYFLD